MNTYLQASSFPRLTLPACFYATRSILTALMLAWANPVHGQAYGTPDQGEAGDAAIQAFLRADSELLDAGFTEAQVTAAEWEAKRSQYKEEYLYMLGLWPLPERTPLQPRITGHYAGEGFQVELLHFQSRPHLYVTANLYRPTEIKAGERLPAVLYVCGHSPRGRNGNKTAYQAHGIWFARHGYVCLILDTLQLGEIASIHHGTYRENRWWWHSRGYTPAGVECWNGVRGLDYLVSRPEIDPSRLAVTGISGGGAATFWIAAADERVKAAVPISGMADLTSYVSSRVINGHCDCMFLYNTFRWPWTRIAALVAPRPLLFVNSDQDAIFPMDANERVINRLERFYSRLGASDLVDAVVSVGGHAYRQDIRQAAFRFLNTHLKHDPRPVGDSEIDLVTGSGDEARHPIDPQKLRVFPTDDDLPKDELNSRQDEFLVAQARPTRPNQGEFNSWRQGLLAELRRVVFRPFPERIPAARPVRTNAYDVLLETEGGLTIRLQPIPSEFSPATSKKLWLILSEDPAIIDLPKWLKPLAEDENGFYRLMTRGGGENRWTRKNPPNYVERSHALLGRTVDQGRVWDIIATVRYLRDQLPDRITIAIAGQGGQGILGAYAALFEPEISEVVLHDPPASHMDVTAPILLNILRVCDIPEVLGMLAPRALTLLEAEPELTRVVTALYQNAGAVDRYRSLP